MKYLLLWLVVCVGITFHGYIDGVTAFDVFTRCYFSGIGILACVLAKWSKLL